MFIFLRKQFLFLLFFLAWMNSALSEDLPWYVNHYNGPVKKIWVAETQDNINSLGFGMFELSQFPDLRATPEQQKNADELVTNSIQNALRRGWFDQKNAFADGFELMFDDETHYINKTYIMDSEVLNPERPEFLMYYSTKKGPVLMGIMYGAFERGPQVGGPLTLWHYHLGRVSCYENGRFPLSDLDANGKCGKGVPLGKSPEMLHVWFFKHPDGPFATRMTLNQEEMDVAIKQIEKITK